MGRNVLIECFFVYVHFGTVSALKFFLLWNSTLEGTIMTLMIKKKPCICCAKQRPTWRRSMAIPLNVKNAAKPFSPKRHWEATVTLTTITSHILVLTVQYHSAPNNLLETHNTAIQFNCTICNIAFQSKSIFNRQAALYWPCELSQKTCFGICWFSGASQV